MVSNTNRRRVNFGLLLCALSNAVAVQALAASQRVIGGTAAPEGMFPFMAHIFKGGNAHCGATIIDPQWAVTAAHCVADKDGDKSGAGNFVASKPGDFKLGFGTNSGGLVNSVDVESIVVNPSYDATWYTSDIALLKLKTSDQIISKAKPITISQANISSGQTLIISGWGQTDTNDGPQAKQLMYAGVVVEQEPICSKNVPDWNGNNGRYVCTSYSTAPGIGTCFGDSGGPLLINTQKGYQLLGIIGFDINTKDSSNLRCAQDGNLSYYTRISSYLSFISKSTGIPDSLLVGARTPLAHTTTSNSSSSATNSTSSTNSKEDKSSASGSKSDSKSSSSSSSSSSGKDSKNSSKGKATATEDGSILYEDSGDSQDNASGGSSGDKHSAGASAAANNQKNSAASISSFMAGTLSVAILAALV